ncbi:MAG: GGDEF domain-containing protein [Acidobacteriota bacterium]|nr:GGDEF domain-containing protein [Acidobacteriota bacterium]
MSRPAALGIILLSLLVIAVVDFQSGFELRTFPLYYAPIALAAWHFGRGGALAAAVLASLGWFVSNQLAGLQYTNPLFWVFNTLVQGSSFAIVGWLVATLRQSQLRERELARIDSLTGLANSRAWYEDGSRMIELCRRTRRPVTLAYIDLDYFKTVNDRDGHAAGDRLLQAVAQALRSATRAADLPARMGGDEFAVLFPELGAEQVGPAITRLYEMLTRTLADMSDGVTASVGVVTFLTPPSDLEPMVQAADALMYRAKQQGRNQLCREVRPA